MIDLTVVIPCYNEEKGIGSTITNLINEIKNNKLNWKIIVIDDGSTDDSKRILKEIKYENFKILEHPYNKGYGAAIKTGINNASTDYIAMFDADGQHRFEYLLKMAKNVGSFDMLIGKREKTSHKDWMRMPGKWLLSKVANYLTETKIPDLNSGLRIIKRNIIIKLLHLFPQGFSFSTTSTIAFMNMGFNVGYYPIIVNKRVGKSSVKQLRHGPQTLLLIIRLIVLFNPLKVFLPISFLSMLVGIIYEIIYGLILYPNGVKLIPAAFFLMITSVLIFFFGLVVDQISELRKHLSEYKK